MTNQPTRLFIADDHALLREGMRALLAANGEDALRQIEERCPSVVLMDINMPGINGIEATRRIQDVMTFMMAGENAEGAPPFEFSGGAGPIEAGMTAWYEADLPSGEYGIICFLPSPANEGAPHFMLGMVQQVSVP